MLLVALYTFGLVALIALFSFTLLALLLELRALACPLPH